MMEGMLGSACRLGIRRLRSGRPHGDYPEARVLDGVAVLPFELDADEGMLVDIVSRAGVVENRVYRMQFLGATAATTAARGCFRVGSLTASGDGRKPSRRSWRRGLGRGWRELG